MLRGCVLIVVLGLLLSPWPAHASWFSRNWPTIAGAAIKILPLLGRDVSAMDTNGDGVLDERELAKHIGEREDLEKLMMMVDTDGDGHVTRREMEDVLDDVRRSIQ